MAERLTIGQRINNVRKQIIGYIKKEKRIASHKGVEHDVVTAHVRQAIIDNDVLIIPTETQTELKNAGKTTDKGSPITVFVAQYKISFCCCDDLTDKVDLLITGIGEDYGDKGPGKAISYATKTAILKLFNIETGESDESRIESLPMSVPEETISEINKLKNKLNIEQDSFKERLKSKYGVDKVADLSKTDAKELKTILNNMLIEKQAKKDETGNNK